MHSDPLQDLIHKEYDEVLGEHAQNCSVIMKWENTIFLSKFILINQLLYSIRYTIGSQEWLEIAIQWLFGFWWGKEINETNASHHGSPASNICKINMLRRLTMKATDFWLGYRRSKAKTQTIKVLYMNEWLFRLQAKGIHNKNRSPG